MPSWHADSFVFGETGATGAGPWLGEHAPGIEEQPRARHRHTHLRRCTPGLVDSPQEIRPRARPRAVERHSVKWSGCTMPRRDMQKSSSVVWQLLTCAEKKCGPRGPCILIGTPATRVVQARLCAERRCARLAVEKDNAGRRSESGVYAYRTREWPALWHPAGRLSNAVGIFPTGLSGLR